MKKAQLKTWSLLALVLFLLLSGCSSTATSANEESNNSVPLELELEKITFDREKDVFMVTFKTNIEAGTEVNAILYSPIDQSLIGYSTLTLTNDYEDGSNLVEFANEGLSEQMIDGFVLQLDLEVKNEKAEENNSELKVQSNEYTMNHTMPKANLVDEVEEDSNIGYSAEFVDYNTKYYAQFRTYMDLIASNFEILAMDGFSNQDIVDDLTTWTSEFNGLLDVYATDSVPVNQTDQELKNHTLEMISKQRLVNENIISGLAEYNETYFITAGEHLESVTEMYLEGYGLLEK